MSARISCIFVTAPQLGQLCYSGTRSTPICAEPWMPERAKVALLLKRVSPKTRAVSWMVRPTAEQRPGKRSPTTSACKPAGGIRQSPAAQPMQSKCMQACGWY